MAKAKQLPSGKWRTRVYSHTEIVNGKEKRIYESFTADTKKESEFMAAKFAMDKQPTTSVSNLTLGEAIDKLIEMNNNIWSPGTTSEKEKHRRLYLQSIMNKPLKKLTNSDIQVAFNLEANRLSPKTLRNIRSTLKCAFDTFRPDFYLKVNLPPVHPVENDIPTVEIFKRIWECAEGTEIEIPILLAGFGPLRRGEISPLTIDDIDFKCNTIRVNKDMVIDGNREWVTKRPKTIKSNRIIDMPDFVMDIIKQAPVQADGRIVPLHPDAISQKYRRMLAKKGLPHYRFHDLRHFAASYLDYLRIPEQLIMARGGWSTNKTLKRVYTHRMKDQDAIHKATIFNSFEEMHHEMHHEKRETLKNQRF